MKILRIIGIAVLASVSLHLLPLQANALTIAERVKGKILLDVENNGEAWYVYPGNLQRYYLGRPADAFDVMRFLGLGITNANLAKIPKHTDNFEGDRVLRERLSGYILLQVEEHGEAWYLYPGNLKRYYLGRPADAFALMTDLGLGITEEDLSSIPIGAPLEGPITQDQNYQSYTLAFERGSFPIYVSRLSRAAYRMVSDTGDATDCDANCSAQSLSAYAAENMAAHGIHGSYFCPPDYPGCSNRINSFLPPFFNSALDRMINEDALPFHAGPMIIQTSDFGLTYFHRTIDFGYTVAEYEQRTGKNVIAAVSNYPALVENGNVIVQHEPLEQRMHQRATRGAIGYSDQYYYLVIARSASVIDMAHIMKILGSTYAINLDGGGSAALYYGSAYAFGPGRLLPNAILFPAR